MDKRIDIKILRQTIGAVQGEIMEMQLQNSKIAPAFQQFANDLFDVPLAL